MKCSSCGAAMRPQDRKCRRCGKAATRPSDAIAQKMLLSHRVAVACGVVLIAFAGVLLLYGAVEFSAALLALGVLLCLIGMLMR